MTYSKLQSILPKDELHYVSDSDQFFADNELPIPTDYKFIVFSETVDYWTDTVLRLKSNNIDFIIKTDEWNLDYILIK
jgi:pyridoxine/pyridoxamine 5'-phosphate oxidase